MKRRLYRLASFFLAATFAAGLSLAAQGASAPVTKTVELTAGAATTIDLGKPVADVLVANPSVAEVGSLRSNRLYVVGRAVGDTNILAFDEQGNPLSNINIHVRIDDTLIRDSLRQFFPLENIDVKTIKTDIVLTGTVSTPAVANQVRELASRFIAAQQAATPSMSGAGAPPSPMLSIVDLMKVRGEQQVMLKVKVIEAKRGILREYGLETDYNPEGVTRAGNDPNFLGSTFNAVAGTGLQSLAPFSVGRLIVSDAPRFKPFKVAIQGLERDGLINTLAEPNLTAISGETAGFLAGGEFPVPTGRDQDGNITLEFKQFGVALNFTPTVLSSDRISLQLSTEVSARSDDDGVIIVNTRIPGLTVRRAETTVQMGSGGTLMIAGLLKSDDVHSLSGAPGFQDVPILGELFKSKSFSRNESELIILVTPYLVEPYAEAQAEQVFETGAVRETMPPVMPVTPAPVFAPVPLPSPQQTGDAAKAVRSSGPVHLDAAPARPVAAPAPAPVVARAGDSPLSRTFISNLRGVYGNKAPGNLAESASFGYIVD